MCSQALAQTRIKLFALEDLLSKELNQSTRVIRKYLVQDIKDNTIEKSQLLCDWNSTYAIYLELMNEHRIQNAIREQTPKTVKIPTFLVKKDL